jgi:hypothetical protein
VSTTKGSLVDDGRREYSKALGECKRCGNWSFLVQNAQAQWVCEEGCPSAHCGKLIKSTPVRKEQK